MAGFSFSNVGNDLSGLGSVIGGIGSLVGGMDTAAADEAQAQGYGEAAQYAQINSFLSAESGGLQQLATARQAQHVAGTQAAYAAANGLKIAGSSASVMRDTVQQGALAEGMIGLQTSINVANYQGEAAADLAMQKAAQDAASAASSGGIFGFLGGAVGGIAKLFAL